MKLKHIVITTLLCSLLLNAQEIYYENYYISPDSVSGLLKKQETKQNKSSKTNIFSYEKFKNNLKKKYMLELGGDYHLVYFGTNDSLGDQNSVGGVFRIFGEWQLLNPNTNNKSSIVFKVENRHKFSDVSPFDFATDIGYAGLLQSTYTDQGNRLTVLYWKQNYLDGRLTTYSGFLDSTEYLDIYLLISPWNAFGNLVFATGSATIAGMPDGGLGAMAAYWMNDTTYIVGSIVDANANPTQAWKGFDTFFNDFETLKTLEVGLTTAKEQLFFDNFHITLWQIDARQSVDSSEGYGVSFSLTHTINKEWFTFLRGGYAKDGGSILTKSLSSGLSHFGFMPKDIYGIGLNWGKPNEELYGKDPKEQYTSEIFYRYQANKHIQFTPSIQLILNPALNPQDNFLTVFGFRLEATF